MCDIGFRPNVSHKRTISDGGDTVNKNCVARLGMIGEQWPRKGIKMTNPRIKGRSGEYEIQGILYDHLGLTFKRDIEQFRQADRGDLICDECDFPFIIEVKRYGKTRGRPDPKWWDQVCAAADAAGKYPLLCYRYDRNPWRWRVPVSVVMAAGLPHGMYSAREDADFDWGYACEFDDVTTMMMIIREVMADARD